MTVHEVKPDNVSKAALDLVRADFNPSGQTNVSEAKLLTARLITIAHETASNIPGSGRAAALAVTNYEQAAMWLVKAMTTPQPIPGKDK